MDRRTALLTLGGLTAAATLVSTGEASAAPVAQPWPANIVTDDVTAVLGGSEVRASAIHVNRATYRDDDAIYVVRTNRSPGDSITKHRYGDFIDIEFFPVVGNHLDEAVIAIMESSILCGDALLERRCRPAEVVSELSALLGHLPHFLVLHPDDADRVLPKVGGMRCIVSRFAVPGFCFGSLAPARTGAIYRRGSEAAMYLHEGTAARVILAE